MLAISDKVFGKKCEEYLSRVREEAETIFVTGEEGEEGTVVFLTQERYNKLLKAEKNADFLINLEVSRKQIEEGKLVVKTIEELEMMANG